MHIDDDLPTFADVEAAAKRLDGVARRTPLLESDLLNQRVSGRLLVKAEPLQRTGSFKFRGAYNAISKVIERDGKRPVVAFSSGNHAQGVAFAAKLLGVPATIVMPSDAPAIKQRNTKAYGAELRLIDRYRDSREEVGAEIAETTGCGADQSIQRSRHHLGARHGRPRDRRAGRGSRCVARRCPYLLRRRRADRGIRPGAQGKARGSADLHGRARGL